MLAIIRVFTTTDKAVMASHGRLISNRYKLKNCTYCIPDQPYGVYDEATERQAEPKIVATAKQAAAAGARAILISCAADPAIDQVRKAVHLPVVGAGSAAAAVGLTLGERVGVLNLAGPTPARMARLLGEHLVMELSPQGVRNTTDLLTPAGREAALTAAKKLAQAADVIVFGCTGYTTIRLLDDLQPQIEIPIVDAVQAAGAVVCSFLTDGVLTDHN